MSEIEIVYLGRRLLNDNKVGCAFLPLDTLESLIKRYNDSKTGDINDRRFEQDWTILFEKSSSLYEAKGIKLASIGGVYKTEGDIVDGKIKTMIVSKLQWAKPLPGNVSGFVLAWQSIDRDVELDKRRKSAEKAADNDPRLSEAISVLRYRYQRIPAGMRRGFKLWLLEQLEKR